MAQEISLVKAEVLNGNKSASIESGLQDIITTFKGCTANTKTLSFTHIKSGTLDRILRYLSSKRQSSKTENEPTSLSIVEVQDDGTKKECDLTLKRLKDFWINPNFTLSHKWATLSDFFVELTAVCKNYERMIAEHRIERLEHTDLATEQLYGTIEERIVTPLGESLLPPTVNDADYEFVYDHLRTNSGEFYWYNNDNLSPIYKDEKNGIISNTCDFWEDWMSFAYPLLRKYQHEVIINAEYIAKNTPIEAGMPVESFDQILSNKLPRVVLQNIALVTKIRKDKEHCYPDGYEVVLKGESGMPIETWRKVFAKTMFTSLQRSKVRAVKQFSNVKGNGLTYFSLDGINVNGDEHYKRPELPKKWNEFFFSKTGDRPIFACDVEMSLLRVAYFITRLIVEDSYTRQILFCTGGGNDGKTTFCETIAAIIGSENAASVNPNELSNDANRVGLLNKSFVYMPDVQRPSDILDNPIVKQLTGRDTMSMRKLYCSPFNYTPEHCFIAVTTNKTVYAKGIHQTSRVLPLTFQINYKQDEQKTPAILKSELLSEKTEFIQWCFDMVKFYGDRKNQSGDKLNLIGANSLLLLTDEAYEKWLNGDKALLDIDDIQKSRMLQLRQESEALNASNRFVALLDEDAEESDAELFTDLITQFFQIKSGAFCSRADIQKMLIENESDILIRAVGFKVNNLNYCSRYRAFMKFLANIEDVSEDQRRCNGVPQRGFKGIELASDYSYSHSTSSASTVF